MVKHFYSTNTQLFSISCTDSRTFAFIRSEEKCSAVFFSVANVWNYSCFFRLADCFRTFFVQLSYCTASSTVLSLKQSAICFVSISYNFCPLTILLSRIIVLFFSYKLEYTFSLKSFTPDNETMNVIMYTSCTQASYSEQFANDSFELFSNIDKDSTNSDT